MDGLHTEGLFRSTFAKVALTILVTVAVLSMALLINFQADNAQLIQRYTADQLYQIKQSTDMLLENARRTILSYSVNGDVLKLINQAHEMDSLELYETLRRIEKLKHSKVQSEYLCFYNQDLGSIFYQSKQYPADEFADRSLIELLRSGNTFTNFYPMLRSAPDYERLYQGAPEDSNMYTFVYTSSPDGQMKNAIILNIPVSIVDQSIGEAHAAIGSEILIVNHALEVIRGNDAFAYGSVIENEPDIAAAMASKQPTGYTVGSVRGEKSMISYVESDVANWRYLRVTPYRVITDAAWRMIWKDALTALALLVPLLAIGWVITRNIQGAYRRRLQEMEQAYRAQSRAAYMERQQHLAQIAMGLQEMDKEVIEGMQLRVEAAGPHAFWLFAIDRYASYCREHSEEERSQNYYEIVQRINDQLNNLVRCETMYLSDGVFAVWMQGDVPEPEALHGILDSAQQAAGATCSCLLADPVPTLADIPLCVRELKEAFNYRIYERSHLRAHIRDVREIAKCGVPLSDRTIAGLADALMLGNRDALEARCRALLAEARALPYPAVQLVIMRIAMAVQAAVTSKGYDSDLVRLEDWMDLTRDIADCPPIEAIEARLNALFQDIAGRMAQDSRVKDLRFEQTHQRALAYLHAEYADPNLTPDSVAERLKLSPEYFKKVYKANTGTSFSEEINRCRLGAAIEQLMQTDLPIADIAQRCGFTNVNYFYTLFKRKHGVTAAEYRRIHAPQARGDAEGSDLATLC